MYLSAQTYTAHVVWCGIGQSELSADNRRTRYFVVHCSHSVCQRGCAYSLFLLNIKKQAVEFWKALLFFFFSSFCFALFFFFFFCQSARPSVCECVCVCVCACVRACRRACVCVCLRVCARAFSYFIFPSDICTLPSSRRSFFPLSYRFALSKFHSTLQL